MYGSYPAIAIRAFVALMWTAILTVEAGEFLQRMIEAIWPSFIHFPNHLPANAGITSAGILCFMLYWVLQTSEFQDIVSPSIKRDGLTVSSSPRCHANRETPYPLLGEGSCGSTNLPCAVHLGCSRDTWSKHGIVITVLQ